MWWKDPRFWFSAAVTFAIGVSSGTLVLTNAIPGDWIKPVTAWCGILAFMGSALQTSIQGYSSTTSSRLASAAQVDGVKGLEVTPELAQVASDAVGGNARVVTTKP